MPRYQNTRTLQEAAILAGIPAMDRHALGRCIEAMIERLDHLCGDADYEPEWDCGADDFGEPLDAAAVVYDQLKWAGLGRR